MSCRDCNASPTRLCAVHARTSNHDTDEDVELDRLRARNRELEEEVRTWRAWFLFDCPHDAEARCLCTARQRELELKVQAFAERST